VIISCVLVILMLAITTKESQWHIQNRDCATGWMIEVSSSENCKKYFPSSHKSRVQPSLLFYVFLGSFPKVKQSACDGKYSPPSTAKDKNKGNIASNLLMPS